MPAYVLGSYLIYVIINAFTPGPGNLLALNTVTNFGKRRGRPLFFGTFLGYYTVQFTNACIVYTVGSLAPQALRYLKYIGAAYILFLAIKIAVSRPPEAEGEKKASFLQGFLLQLVNVKIWLFGLTALTGYVTDYSTSFGVLLGFQMLLATVGCLATITWVELGALLQNFYRRHYRPVNVVLALTLGECIYSILR